MAACSGFMAGAVDRMPAPVDRRATMREVIGTALTSRPFLVMATAYFVCGLQLVFLTTHLPNYLAICGADPMLSATAQYISGRLKTNISTKFRICDELLNTTGSTP